MKMDCKRSVTMKTKLVIFDLDGTILNTIADLADSTNYALKRLGYPERSRSEYPFMVGNGVSKLFERALPESERTEENVERVRRLFMPHYDVHNTDSSRPYEGIEALLHALCGGGMMVAVASNKYQAAVEKLVACFFAGIPFAAVFGQREGVPVKPDPTIVSDIMKETGVTAGEVLYVGDSAVDMQTAARAGVTACGVTWGFRPRVELEAEHPAYIVDRPEEVLACLSE